MYEKEMQYITDIITEELEPEFYQKNRKTIYTKDMRNHKRQVSIIKELELTGGATSSQPGGRK